jgi:peptide/nickel transport system substrate-binding protein
MQSDFDNPVALSGQLTDGLLVRQLSRRSILQAGAGTVAVGGLSALLAACGGSSKSGGATSGAAGASASGSSDSSGSTNNDTLTVASAFGATNFDPESQAGSLTLYPLLYDSLFDTSTPPVLADAQKLLASYNPAPALATAWDQSADKLTWTLTLNTKAKSAAGNAFTSADVLWSFERNLAMKWYGGIFLNRIGITDISQVTASGPDKVVMKLNGVVGRTYFLLLLGNFIVPIFDSTEAKKHITSSDPWAGKWIQSNATGFGPYTIKSSSPDGTLNVFQANPNYYGDAPFKTLTWRQTTDTNSQLQLLLKGQAQVIDSLAPVQVAAVEKSSVAKVTTVATTGATFIGFNCSQPIYKDVAFRQGIAYAIPFQDIVNSVYKGQATEMKSVLPSFFQGFTDEYWTYTQDAAKAKSMLAPYAGKSITLQYRSGDTVLQTLAVLIQSSLAAVGLKIALDGMDPTSFQTKLTAATLSMWIDPQSTPLVPDSLYGLQLLFPSKPTQVLLHYSNADVDAAVGQLATTSDPTQQVTLIKAAQKVLIEELPIIPLAQVPGIVPTAKNVSNIRGHGSNFTWAKDLKYT